MLRLAFTGAFVFVLLMRSQGQTPSRTQFEPQSPVRMLELLERSGSSGSLEISGQCDFPHFPPLTMSIGDPSFQTLHEMLADEPAMQVTRDPDETIRMIEGNVPTDLLSVRIRHISFEDGAHNDIYGAKFPFEYDSGMDIRSANLALRLVLSTPEVEAFMKARDIHWPSIQEWAPGNLSAPSWPPESPYFLGTLDNVTLAEALDHILNTFHGIWFYQDCPQSEKRKRLVYFHFYHLLPDYIRSSR